MAAPTIELGTAFSLDDLAALADGDAHLAFSAPARSAVARAHAFVDQLGRAGDDAPNVYGVNTGFGALAETRIEAAQMRALQRNLVRSHACGVGPSLRRACRARDDRAARAGRSRSATPAYASA